MPRYDDEFEDDDRPARRGPSTEAVAAVAGATALVALLVCGGVGLLAYRAATARQQEAVRAEAVAAERSAVVRAEADQAAADAAAHVAEARLRADQMRAKADGFEKAGEPTDKGRANAALTQFLDELRAGRPDAAYQLATPGFRERVPPADFRRRTAVVASDDAKHLSLRADFRSPPSGAVFVFENFGGWVRVKATVAKEGDAWKVDRFFASTTGFTGDAPPEDSDRGRAAQTLEDFLAELKADRPEAAYALTTADYRERVPAADFGRVAGRVSASDRGRVWMRAADHGRGDVGRTFAFENWGGFLTVKATVVKEGDGWRVDRFSAGRWNEPDDTTAAGQAVLAVEQFLADVRAGRADAAYQQTTTGFRDLTPLANFRTRVIAFTRGGLAQTARPDAGQAADDADTVTFRLFLGREGTAELVAIREGGTWRVDRLTVTPSGMAGPPPAGGR